MAWVDAFGTWIHDLAAKVAAGQDVGTDLLVGAELVREAAAAHGDEGRRLAAWAERLDAGGDEAVEAALEPDLERLMREVAPRGAVATSTRIDVLVERQRAAEGAWYELFPRSWSPVPGRHGTLDDVRRRLPYIPEWASTCCTCRPSTPSADGPQGEGQRAGRDGRRPGSPWAIGAAGGHNAVHPELGTLEDFDALVATPPPAGSRSRSTWRSSARPTIPGSPSTPSGSGGVPDGTVAYAENPPKKYEDIYPFDFETDDRGLVEELEDVVLFWIGHGVRISAWTTRTPSRSLLGVADREHARGASGRHIPRRGVHASPSEVPSGQGRVQPVVHVLRLAQHQAGADRVPGGADDHRRREYYRPNFWPNTPDILPEYLQFGGRAAFVVRLVLAATLTAPTASTAPLTSCSRRSGRPGSEEYDLREVRDPRWEVERPESLALLIARLNRIRRENPALHEDGAAVPRGQRSDHRLQQVEPRPRHIVVVVNLDPSWRSRGGPA